MKKFFMTISALLILISCSKKQEIHNYKKYKETTYYSHIDSFDYTYLMISCDAPVAYNVLSRNIELLDKKYDKEYFRNNYLSNKDSMDNRNKIIHFVAFGYFQDSIMENELVQYIFDHDTASARSIRGDNRFPYYYAKKTYDEMNNVMDETLHYAIFTKQQKKSILKKFIPFAPMSPVSGGEDLKLSSIRRALQIIPSSIFDTNKMYQ